MEVIEKAAFRVIGIQVVADWNGLHKEMPATWNIFKERVQEINHRVNDKMIDISIKCDQGLYTQMVCVEVEVEVYSHIPEGMVTYLVPNQKYIHYRHKGPLHEIAQSFGKMYAWAEEHKYKADECKIDYGYTKNEADEVHDLYVKIND